MKTSLNYLSKINKIWWNHRYLNNSFHNLQRFITLVDPPIVLTMPKKNYSINFTLFIKLGDSTN